MSPAQRLQLERGVQHLHGLGPRATAELLAEVVSPVGEVDFLLDKLEQYRRLSPDLLRAVGGDRFPRRIFRVEDAA
ncbi:hypothetical protein [Lichenicoccus roseus]|uniref:Uncharacterized protein n=1 Tax=Lichenicoccus roseus TaxID=2683649 RepID=A0A5R9J1P0_9PROT|nr:hypothetical protein [Lichenicoccus roseus]TLU71462.1 hypothetical protein FE263_16310 [Lichenicoccus roseus]